MADRGYFERAYLAALDDAGASFIRRASAAINPRVIRAFDAHGKRQPALDDRLLKAACQAPHRVLDVDVCWSKGPNAPVCRLIVSARPGQRDPLILITNLARSAFSPAQLPQAYRLRWQIELLFKEYKAYTHRQAFDTANPAIAEGLIWAAVAAAAIQRFMAHTTQRVHAVEVSSEKAAKAADPMRFVLFKALAVGRARRIREAFDDVLGFLAINARRAHPQRDRRSGRTQLGIETVGTGA